MKRFKDSGTMNEKESSGRPRSVTTEKNTDLIEELICSQEEAPHTHLAPRKIAEQTEISRSSIRRMIKRRNFSQLKRVKTREMNDGCRYKKYAYAIALAKKFELNARIWLKKQYGKMKKILPLTFLLTYTMTGYMEKEKILMLQMKTCLPPRIICQEKLWFPLESLGTAPRNLFL